MKLHEKLRQESDKNSIIASWAIVLIGFLISSLVTYFVAKKNRAEDELKFEYETNNLIRRIQNRISQYEGALIQTRAFIMNTDSVSRKQLRNYIKDTEIFRRYPGLQGIGYSVMVSPGEVANHVKELRKDFPEYKIWPEYKRDIYSSIVVIEPFDWRNIRAIGYDMYQEPIRKRAMNEARDSNSVIMSERIVLVQEIETEQLPGLNFYLPVYKKDAPIDTPEQRQKNLVAFIYSPFRTPELFKAIFSDLEMRVDIEVFEGNITTPEKLLYNFDKEYGNVNFRMEETKSLNILGRNLVMHFTPLKNFDPSYSHWKLIGVMLLGGLLTYGFFLIYLITRRQLRTARIVAEEKETLLAKEKEHVSARDDFLSIASHELKTPLTSLKLQAQVMKRAIDRKDPTVFSPEKVTHLISQIDNQTTRLTRLVDDMLDISRIRTGRLKMIKEEVELNSVVKDVVERLTPQFMAAIGEAPSIECGREIIGHWDKFRLEQVLMNLLTNAIRYGNDKPVKIKVVRTNEEACIYVTDQGIGIAPENITKIFERFERAGMSASEVSGMGLGLFITNQIVKAHGGSITVDSTPGKGSTFIVVLPLN